MKFARVQSQLIPLHKGIYFGTTLSISPLLREAPAVRFAFSFSRRKFNHTSRWKAARDCWEAIVVRVALFVTGAKACRRPINDIRVVCAAAAADLSAPLRPERVFELAPKWRIPQPQSAASSKKQLQLRRVTAAKRTNKARTQTYSQTPQLFARPALCVCVCSITWTQFSTPSACCFISSVCCASAAFQCILCVQRLKTLTQRYNNNEKAAWQNLFNSSQKTQPSRVCCFYKILC